jgi:hypothetical protein
MRPGGVGATQLQSWLWSCANKVRKQTHDNVCKPQQDMVTYTDLASSLSNLHAAHFSWDQPSSRHI